MSDFRLWLSVALTLVMTACAGQAPQQARDELTQHALTREPLNAEAQAIKASMGPMDPAQAARGGLAPLLLFARRQSPAVLEGFERWRSEVEALADVGRLPDPRVEVGYFLRSVETRVGPQVARVGLRQTVPWPTGLTARGDEAGHRAQATHRRLEATILVVEGAVRRAYWDLWQIRALRAIHTEHLEVVQGLSETVGARVATGQSSLADQQQVDLTAARLADALRGMEEAGHQAQARLWAAVGLGGGFSGTSRHMEIATPDEPPPARPVGASDETLSSRLSQHPALAALMAEQVAAQARARAAEAAGWPDVTLALDWVITDQAAAPGVADSGQDALMVGVGLRLPLARSAYAGRAESARAAEASKRWAMSGRRDALIAELQTAQSVTRDAVRRVKLHHDTLLPQAESAYASVLGAYAAGQGAVADVLLAQQTLLDLRVGLERARADYARGLARLEQVTGAPVEIAPEPRPSQPFSEPVYPTDQVLP